VSGVAACAKGLRPGRYAYVKATGDGVDLHAIVVHLKSGSTQAARQEWMTVLSRLDEAVVDLLARDRDIVILGDFNTMGTGTPGVGALRSALLLPFPK
jgi:endonuclease/exonuclease/phosphatase family metal-dependent hydrolase